VLFRRRRASLAAARVGDLDDLPSGRRLRELKRVDATVAERVVQVKVVFRPEMRDGSVHPNLGLPNAFVPYRASFRRCDSTNEAVVWLGANNPLAHRNEASGRIEDRTQQGGVARAHPLEEPLRNRKYLRFVGRLGAGAPGSTSGEERDGDRERAPEPRAALRWSWRGGHGGGFDARRLDARHLTVEKWTGLELRTEVDATPVRNVGMCVTIS